MAILNKARILIRSDSTKTQETHYVRLTSESYFGDTRDIRQRLIAADTREPKTMMRALYAEPYFTFRFAEERWIDRVHLTDVPAGKIARAYRLEVCIASGVTDEHGWVAFSQTVHVCAGDGFIVVVE